MMLRLNTVPLKRFQGPSLSNLRLISSPIRSTSLQFKHCRYLHQSFYQLNNASRFNSEEVQLYNEIKRIQLSPKLNPAQRSNLLLEKFKELQITSLYDSRFQSLLRQVRQDNQIPTDFIFELNRVLELYHQNKQHNDDYQYEMFKDKGSSGHNFLKKYQGIVKSKLSKYQIISVYFLTMSGLLVGVTMYGPENMSLVELVPLSGIIVVVSFIFNPF